MCFNLNTPINMNKYPITTTAPVYINNRMTEAFDPRIEVFQLIKHTPIEITNKINQARNKVHTI